MAFPLVLALCCSVRAQTVNDVQSKNGEKPVAEQPARDKAAVAEAREHVSKFAVTTVTEGREVAVEMIERPLLLFGDAARLNEAGSLWGWGKTGRPVALLELYRNVGPNEPWRHTVTLTSPSVVSMKGADGASWSPRTSHFELHDVLNTEPASDKATVRLRQMKDISRRFEAHEFWDPDNSRFELRLLVQPVHRYSDAEAKLLDGAIFVLTHATNPEVLLFVEAHGAEAGAAAWKYGLVRMGDAELHVELDHREVWKQPRMRTRGTPTDPYWFFLSRDVP